MKRKITILLCLIGSLSAFAQTSVINIGDMVNTGSMRVDGSFHAKTDMTQAKDGQSRFKHTGSLRVDTLIMYSNENKDGLFSWKGGTVTSDTKAVIVRRSFRQDIWYYLSFPFDVDDVRIPGTIKGIRSDDLKFGYIKNNLSDNFYDPNNPSKAFVPGDFYTGIFDPKLRADSSYAHDANGLAGYKVSGWRDSLFQKSLQTYFKKGIGYMIATESGAPGCGGTCGGSKVDSLDFIVTNTTNITALFANANKRVDLQYFATPKAGSGATMVYTTNHGSGWNFVGGQFETYFYPTETYLTYNSNAGGTSAGWNKALYLRSSVNGRADTGNYTQILLSPSTKFGSGKDAQLSPYSPFFIQVDSIVDTDPTSLYLEYNPVGQVIDDPSWSSGDFYRSPVQTAEATKDFFSLHLNKKGETGSEPTYIQIGDYSDQYIPAEDAVTFNVGSAAAPNLWSLSGAVEHNKPIRLFLNSLPAAEEEVAARSIPIGFSTPTAGEYTFSLSPIESSRMSEAILQDKTAGKQTDLLLGDYTFSAGGAAVNDDRFLLFVQMRAGNSIITPEGKDIYGYVKDGWLTVANIGDGDRVRVVDLAGRTVVAGAASGSEFRAALSHKGVYLVTVKGARSVTLKVLNK
jgi:hypothetical protein